MIWKLCRSRGLSAKAEGLSPVENILRDLYIFISYKSRVKAINIHWHKKGVSRNPSAFDKLSEMIPFLILASGPNDDGAMTVRQFDFAGRGSSLYEIREWQGLWRRGDRQFITFLWFRRVASMVVQFIAFTVKFYCSYGWWIYYICGQKLLHLWPFLITFMVGITFMGDTTPFSCLFRLRVFNRTFRYQSGLHDSLALSAHFLSMSWS